LRGRIDRVDYQDEGTQCCVLDYKTQAVTALKNKLKEAGEEVQLACYALTQDASDAEFVSLDGDKITSVVPPHDIRDLSQLNLERLKTVFIQMRNGTPVPAHGSDTVCGYCEMKGLCRRDEWEAPSYPPDKGRLEGTYGSSARA
jgi:ATP-dependent helicase/nuclease subunit B